MLKKTFRSIFIVLCFSLVSSMAVTAGVNVVRVAILREVDHFALSINGRHMVLEQAAGKRISTGIRLLPATVSLEDGKIKIGPTVYDKDRILIEPRPDADLKVNDKHFRGNILIINNNGKTLTVVNFVEIEQYIRGVLYREVSDKWPMEAIKAQAVAARTYAVYSMEQFAARDYDLTNDVSSQVYGGKSGELYRTNLAVKRTKGEVLTYKGKVFPSFFHANSGGMTEAASELWDVDVLPLKGGIESPYSVNSPHYRWKLNVRLKDIQDKLNESGHKIGLIKDIRVVERNKSGRVRRIQITTRDGQTDFVDGKAFRDILGPNVLKSNMYDVLMRGWYVDFVGHGWGHGVGLCQWGAYNMARMHFSYKEILSFYYPSSEVIKLNNID